MHTIPSLHCHPCSLPPALRPTVAAPLTETAHPCQCLQGLEVKEPVSAAAREHESSVAELARRALGWWQAGTGTPAVCTAGTVACSSGLMACGGDNYRC